MPEISLMDLNQKDASRPSDREIESICFSYGIAGRCGINCPAVGRQPECEEMMSKVFCTKDGDFPSPNLMVLFQTEGDTVIGGLDDIGWFTIEEEYVELREGEVVYWQPLPDLSSIYEKEMKPVIFMMGGKAGDGD